MVDTLTKDYRNLIYYMNIIGKKEKINSFCNVLSNYQIIKDMDYETLYNFLNDRFKIYIIKGKKRQMIELKIFLTFNSLNHKKYVFSIRTKYKSKRDIDYIKELKKELIEYIIDNIYKNRND